MDDDFYREEMIRYRRLLRSKKIERSSDGEPIRTFSMEIEGPDFCHTVRVKKLLDGVAECRQYYKKGIKTKAYMMPGKLLVVDYTGP